MEEKGLYTYFVSYRHARGYGNTEYTSWKKIESLDDIRRIESKIRENNGAEGVSIDWFTLLDFKYVKTGEA